MTSCCIIGGGDKSKTISYTSFTIACNMHYKNANMLVAIDEPIIKKMLEDNISGYNKQPIVMNKKIGQYYTDSARTIIFDYQNYYNINSISSGLLAIAFANYLNFKVINLIGFDKLLNEHYNKFSVIKQKDKTYILHDSTNNHTVC